MYHVSLYFDEKSDNIIKQHMKQVANKTGNDAMLAGNVPPHITVSAFNTDNPDKVISVLGERFADMAKGEVIWAGLGTFLPHVLYISPVLNEYLDKLSKITYNELRLMSGVGKDINVEISQTYRPFGWMPHTTIAKNLSNEEMKHAFDVMQNRFGVFTGEIVRIGIAKTNPYENIVVYDLK